MTADAFSNCHPAVNFLFFVGAIGFSVLIQHPAYLIAGAIGAAVYYLLLSGRAGWKRIAMLLPMFLALTVVNPLFNTYGERVLFHVFGRPYTVEALLYGAAIAGVFLVMMLWFGCYNAVMTSDKFTSLFGNLIPAISLLLVMVLRMIPSFIRKAGQIMGARKSIGLGAGENSTMKEKLTSGMRTLSALTDWALEGSVVTGDSMRARGYGTAKRRLVVKEDAIHAIVVQAMAHGRHFCIVDDADQRMRVRVSHPLAIVAYVPYFQNLAHNHSFVFVGMSLHKNTLSQPIGRT